MNSKFRSVSYLFKIFHSSSSHLQHTSLKSFQFIKNFLQIENYFHIYISNYSLQTWNSLKLRWEECKNFFSFISSLHYSSLICMVIIQWIAFTTLASADEQKTKKNFLVENLHLNFFNSSDVSLLRCDEVTTEMNNIKMKYLNFQKVI